jgi:hypothetical protein
VGLGVAVGVGVGVTVGEGVGVVVPLTPRSRIRVISCALRKREINVKTITRIVIVILRQIYLRTCWLNHTPQGGKDQGHNRYPITNHRLLPFIILPERCEVSDLDAAPVPGAAAVQE